MANEPCAYYKTALPLWLCEFIVGARRSDAHSRGPSAACPTPPQPPQLLAVAPPMVPWRLRPPVSHVAYASAQRSRRSVVPRLLGVVLLSIGLFWVFRQCRHPRIRAKERWWSVEAALGSTVFVFMLYNGPGFWYSRCVVQRGSSACGRRPARSDR